MKGFFPHYLDVHTGQRQLPSEFSSIDTTLLLFGAFHARSVLNSKEADQLVRQIYERVDWRWMQNADDASVDKPAMLSMGWTPEAGFLSSRWTSFSECLLMYAAAIASPTHGLPAKIWDQIERHVYNFGGIRFVSSYGALFIHQYPHIWLDLRYVRDPYGDPCGNATSAIKAHKMWCMLQHAKFPWINESLWGFSASDTPDGSYRAWGAPPEVGAWDGTIAPHAAGGSLVLLPDECIAALATMREGYPRCFDRFGFVDAFNPGARNNRGWFDPDVIAIDLGLTMLMAENLATRSVQQAATNCPEMKRAMKAIGFYSLPKDDTALLRR